MSVKFSGLPVAPSINSDAEIAFYQENESMVNTSYRTLVSNISGATPTTGTHTTTWGGCFTALPSGNVEYTIIGDTVTLILPNFRQLATATSAATMTTPLPVELRPSVFIYVPCIALSSAPARQISELTISTTGNITVYRTFPGATFVNATTAGFPRQPISYKVN